MDPTINDVYGNRFDEMDSYVYFNDDTQTISRVIRTWGDVKLFDEDEHIESPAEYFKRKLLGE